eukprot:gene37257-50284_t
MQKKRASLSEEQKEQLKEKERIKRQQQRANLSNEEQSIRREKGAEQHRIKRQQQRANLSNEEQSIRREKDAEQHRNKYQEQKSFILQNHHLSNNKLFLNNRRPKINENGDDEDIIEDEVEDKNEDGEDNSDFAVADHVKDWKAYREKRYAKSRIYKKARYAQLKDAEVKLLKAAENSTSDSDIQKLQQLATRRQQILAYGREYGRTYRQNHNRRQWVPIQQVWDEDNPCSHCGRVWLKSVKKDARVRCCYDGKAMDEQNIWPKLQPLPNNIRQIIFGESTIFISDEDGNRQVAHSPLNNIEHFSRNSARYNGVLSISATGIDNGKGGGWERIQGPHAVKLCGRTFHYLPRSNSTGGIQHFILDKYTEALMHAQSFESNNSRIDTTIKDSILRAFWDTLHSMNKFVQHCKIIGDAV